MALPRSWSAVGNWALTLVRNDHCWGLRVSRRRVSSVGGSAGIETLAGPKKMAFSTLASTPTAATSARNNRLFFISSCCPNAYVPYARVCKSICNYVRQLRHLNKNGVRMSRKPKVYWGLVSIGIELERGTGLGPVQRKACCACCQRGHWAAQSVEPPPVIPGFTPASDELQWRNWVVTGKPGMCRLPTQGSAPSSITCSKARLARNQVPGRMCLPIPASG